MSKRTQRALIISTILNIGLSNLMDCKVKAQTSWQSVEFSKPKSAPIMWENISEPSKFDASKKAWEVTPESELQVIPSMKVKWKLLDTDENIENPLSDIAPKEEFTPPSSLEEAEALASKIPLEASDYEPILNLSQGIPTATILSEGDIRIKAHTISPIRYASGTGNQNYAIRLDHGVSETLQISGFYSEADDPLNAPIKGFDTNPANLWKVFGGSVRWRLKKNQNLSLALNGSLESWTVGSGGSDSLVKNEGRNASQNIFNNSGERVETRNIIGSLNIPLTWQTNKHWQFTIAPGISFLPSSQGAGQGGSGEFYGINPYISGGLLWHPKPQLGLTASIAQPLGRGNNSFDANLNYSKVPVISGGLNWHLNPRIALQGLLTNGFGATPATGLLTLPSDNRLGYSAQLVFTADAPDTPQIPLTERQKSLSLGGSTVTTALVPPDTVNVVKASADRKGNFDVTYGLSISNIFQFELTRSYSNNIPQNTIQARTYANDGAINWRGSGKAVLTSQMRNAPIWSALRISMGRNMDTENTTAQGYLFAETPLTWEANSNLAININPKVAWTGVGSLWGMGISANIQLAPDWELMPEANINLNDGEESNGTLGLRWNATDNIAIEAYGTTASSLLDIGQLLNAHQVRWGGRLIIRY